MSETPEDDVLGDLFAGDASLDELLAGEGPPPDTLVSPHSREQLAELARRPRPRRPERLMGYGFLTPSSEGRWRMTPSECFRLRRLYLWGPDASVTGLFFDGENHLVQGDEATLPATLFATWISPARFVQLYAPEGAPTEGDVIFPLGDLPGQPNLPVVLDFPTITPSGSIEVTWQGKLEALIACGPELLPEGRQTADSGQSEGEADSGQRTAPDSESELWAGGFELPRDSGRRRYPVGFVLDGARGVASHGRAMPLVPCRIVVCEPSPDAVVSFRVGEYELELRDWSNPGAGVHSWDLPARLWKRDEPAAIEVKAGTISGAALLCRDLDEEELERRRAELVRNDSAGEPLRRETSNGSSLSFSRARLALSGTLPPRFSGFAGGPVTGLFRPLEIELLQPALHADGPRGVARAKVGGVALGPGERRRLPRPEAVEVGAWLATHLDNPSDEPAPFCLLFHGHSGDPVDPGDPVRSGETRAVVPVPEGTRAHTFEELPHDRTP